MEIPLFPLHTVLAPGLALPLHIFEERYRVMVRRCLDTSSPFGVVLIRRGPEVAPPVGETRELAIAGVGTLAEIREASRYADGRWDLLCVGSTRFAVQDVVTGREPYLVGIVDPVDDETGDRVAAAALVRRVTRRFVAYLRLLQPRDGEAADPIDVQVELDAADDADGEGPLDADDADGGAAAGLRIPGDPSALSFLLTGIVQAEPARKQALLEAPSAEARLRDLDALLGRELMLLTRRLAPFSVDRRTAGAEVN